MKTYEELEVYLQALINKAIYEDEWSASHPNAFHPRTNWIGRWVGDGRCETEKDLLPLLKMEPRSFGPQAVAEILYRLRETCS
jgi:hypothetical protein